MLPENPFDKIHTRDKIQQLDECLSKLETFAQLPFIVQSMRSEFDNLREQVEFLQGEKDHFVGKYNSFVNSTLEEMDDSRFWESPINHKFDTEVYRSVPVKMRPKTAQGVSTRFLTMINLKGGVGKTTLTTNLATAFASGNYQNESGQPLKVLVVDLDFQGSLTRLCLSGDTVSKTDISNPDKNLRATSSWLLREEHKQRKVHFKDLLFPTDIHTLHDNIDVIAADEYLDEVDVQHIVAQVMEARESRFIFRKLFQRPEILEKYDLVFFDCPPRITPSSINALLASDCVIIPTRLDKINSDATARTLSWLGRLQQSKLPGKLPSLAGVIINFAPKGATPRYLDNLKHDLEDYQKKYMPEVKSRPEDLIFKAQISTTVNATYPVDGGDKMKPLALKSLNLGQDPARKIQTAFGDLATELYERIFQ